MMESIAKRLHKATLGYLPFFLFSYFIILVSWIRSNPLLFLIQKNEVGAWNYTLYLFNYEYGFIKRGLIGELFTLLQIPTTYDLVSIVSYISVIILATFFYLPLQYLWKQYKANYGFFLLTLLTLSSPVVIQHFFFDAGRYDIYNYLIFVGIALYLNSIGAYNKFLAFLVVTFSCLVQIAIHEAAFFIIIPITILFWYYFDSSKKAMLFQAVSCMIILFFTYFISTEGYIKGINFNKHLGLLQQIYGNNVNAESLSVIYKVSLHHNIGMTINRFLTSFTLTQHIIFLVLTMPLAYLLLNFIISNLIKYFNTKKALLIISSLSPLLLYPLGLDYFRWWSLALTNIFITIIFLCIKDDCFAKSFFRYLESKSRLVISTVLLGVIVSGPLTVTEAYSYSLYDLLVYINKQ